MNLICEEECLVDLYQHWGTDATVVDAARVSFNADRQDGELETQDVRLISRLARDRHMGCFEHMGMTVVIKCPLFARSHIHRHRTFSYNEVSRRYTSDGITFWIPRAWLRQADSNRQASGEALPSATQDYLNDQFMDVMGACLEAYEDFLSLGVSREQARALLPTALFTRFYMTGNLRNWVHFIDLRADEENAQAVDVEVARQVHIILNTLFPDSLKYLRKHGAL